MTDQEKANQEEEARLNHLIAQKRAEEQAEQQRQQQQQQERDRQQ
jgi:hypothetical protein